MAPLLIAIFSMSVRTSALTAAGAKIVLCTLSHDFVLLAIGESGRAEIRTRKWLQNYSISTHWISGEKLVCHDFPVGNQQNISLL